MTDKKTESSQDERPRSQSPVLTTPANKRVPPSGKPADPGASAGGGAGGQKALAATALILALAAAGFSGMLWLQNRAADETHAQLQAQTASSASAANEAGSQAQQALNQLSAQQARIEALESQLDEAAAIIRDLDEALRTMTDRGSELVLLNDVDHLVTIAQQQLQLGGNVRNAIVALESAQAQLARANRPALASLLQTINGDLDRLRAASTIDIAAFSRQLEELAMLLTDAPLIMPDEQGRQADRPDVVREQPAPTVPPAADEGPWWERAWENTRDWSSQALTSLRDDLGQFIDVRRVDDAQALLMSPDQAARFRENLRTRVMTAQLALMMRQPEIWEAETQAIVRAVEKRYDESSPLTRKALRMARSMADASIDAQLPTVDNTLQALNALREEQARGLLGGEPDVAPAETPEDSRGLDSQPQEAAQEESGSDTPHETDAQSDGGAQADTPSETDGEAGTDSESAEPADIDAAESAQQSAAIPMGNAGFGQAEG